MICEEMSTRRCGTVPLVNLRSSFSGSSDDDNASLSSSKGGMCSISDAGENDHCSLPSTVRIKHLTRNSVSSSRFPKLDECAHFHYDNVELPQIKVGLCEERFDAGKVVNAEQDRWFCVQVTSNARSWPVRRTYENFRMLDRQLHRCVYDRKYSLLPELPPEDNNLENKVLDEYLGRLSDLAGCMINCGPVLNWFELDNRGNRLLVTDEAAINTPAVAAAYAIRPYTSQASDEISFNVGDMISVIDMPPNDESTWWRGKKGFEVGFFPCESVEIIGEKIPRSLHSRSTKPVLRKHGKLIAFFRSFLISRPSRRKLKQTGILKERVFSCDLGEHLLNTGRDIPLVLKACTEFIEEYGLVDGIYRLSGVTSNIQKLRNAFDEDVVPELGEEAIRQDIHSVASLLKMYFRELPNPLLTYQLYDKFVGAVHADEDTRLLRLRDLVQQLPPPHYRTLKHLTLHLSRVASHGSRTGMTPKNVAIVWAPNLLRSRNIENGGVGALHVIGTQAVLTEYLIRYADIIFNQKLPTFNNLRPEEGTPRRSRPKSLAISTPTKLLSLEEARSRVNNSSLQKYIDVGGGPTSLPPKYHTVIELPSNSKRGSVKLKKSPSGWKSFFSRGWHSGSTREKDRKLFAIRKVSTGSLQTNPPMGLQDQTSFGGMFGKNLRSFKSAESLILLSGSSCRNSREEGSMEENSLRTPSHKSSIQSPSPGIQKHGRSTSHDSYFDQPDEPMSSDLDELVNMSSSQKGVKKQKLDDDARSIVERYGTEETVLVEVHATCSPDNSPPLFLRRLSPLSLPQLFLDYELNALKHDNQDNSSLNSPPEEFNSQSPERLDQSSRVEEEESSKLIEAQNPTYSNDSFYNEMSNLEYKIPEESPPIQHKEFSLKRPSLMDLDHFVMIDACKEGSNEDDEDKCIEMSESIDPSQENTLFDCSSLVSEVVSPREGIDESSLVVSDHLFQINTPINPTEEISSHSESEDTAKDLPIDSFAASLEKQIYEEVEQMEISHSNKSCQMELDDSKQESNVKDNTFDSQDSTLDTQEASDEVSTDLCTNENSCLSSSKSSSNLSVSHIEPESESPSKDTTLGSENICIPVEQAMDTTNTESAIVKQYPIVCNIDIVEGEDAIVESPVLEDASKTSSEGSELKLVVEQFDNRECHKSEESVKEPEIIEAPVIHEALSEIKTSCQSSKVLEEDVVVRPSFPSLPASKRHSEPPPQTKDILQSALTEMSPRKPVRPNFQQLFSKFEKPSEQSPPKIQPSLFTQYKILKLQSLTSRSPESAPSDPWQDPILDQYNQEEKKSKPADSPAKMLLEELSSEKVAVLENIPPQEETITVKTVTTSSGIQTSITSTLSNVTSFHDVTTVEVNELIQFPDSDPENDEKTRRERINKIKETRRAQLREKIKLENLTTENKDRVPSTRKSWARTPIEGEDKIKKVSQTSPVTPTSTVATPTKRSFREPKQHSRTSVGKRSPIKDNKLDFSPSKIPTKSEDSTRNCDKPPLQRIGQRRIHERAAMFERPLVEQAERPGRFIRTPTVIR